MPKVQFIDPSEKRKPSELTFSPIPINQYSKTVEEEKANFSNDDLSVFITIWWLSGNLKPC